MINNKIFAPQYSLLAAHLNATLRLHSTTSSASLALLHPWFVTGFADAESCFYVKIYPGKSLKTG